MRRRSCTIVEKRMVLPQWFCLTAQVMRAYRCNILQQRTSTPVKPAGHLCQISPKLGSGVYPFVLSITIPHLLPYLSTLNYSKTPQAAKRYFKRSKCFASNVFCANLHSPHNLSDNVKNILKRKEKVLKWFFKAKESTRKSDSLHIKPTKGL